MLETLIPAFVGGLAKNLYGWYKNAISDGSDLGTAISDYEVKQLIITLSSFVVVFLATNGVLNNWLNIEYAEFYSGILAWIGSSLFDKMVRKKE